MVNYPSLTRVAVLLKPPKPVARWECPPVGSFKFNTDGVARGCLSNLGIGGIVRDEKGVVKVVFSKKAGWGDTNLAEVLVIREAMVIFAASSWVSRGGIIKRVQLKKRCYLG
ncbi:hypothetical protein POUND7_015729 [Theobroma cacao]